jgi:hypothetical protein
MWATKIKDFHVLKNTLRALARGVFDSFTDKGFKMGNIYDFNNVKDEAIAG